MNLTQVIAYGGTYQELWDDNYQLTVRYSGQETLSLQFDGSRWQPVEGSLPPMPLADEFFQQAAHAAAAAEAFVASGLTVQRLSALSPAFCEGAVFAAECLRILMDDFGFPLETAYPYVSGCMGAPLREAEALQLEVLQPRTAHVLRLLQEWKKTVPAARHDLRLDRYKTPAGAVKAGEPVRLFLATDGEESRSGPGLTLTDAAVELYGDEWRAELPMNPVPGGWEAAFSAPEQPAALWYRFRLRTQAGEHWVCPAKDGFHARTAARPDEGFRLTVYARDFETPAWFQEAVLYQIFPDRFAFSDDGTAERGVAWHRTLGQNAELHASRSEEVRWKARRHERSYLPDDFYGGTLKGIREQLPALKEMGVSCVYLNPVFEARSNHRYDTSDYRNIDPVLGSNEDFEVLCREAESLGMHILLDGVFSHTGADSVYFNRDGHYPNPGACQREPSPYDSWYEFRHFPYDYRSWWGYRELPEVDETDPGWQDFIVTGEDSVLRHWLRRGASGWRLDVADELPDEVLCLMRQAVREEKPDGLLLGEVWEDAVIKESYQHRRTYALGNALDTVMNYPFRTAVLDFLLGKSSAFELSDFLTGQQLNYPGPMYRCLMNLLGSHDVARLRTALATGVELKELKRPDQLKIEKAVPAANWERAGALTRLAYVIAFSIPGVPSVYYGDELGMTGVGDPFNRRPYGMNATDDLRPFLSQLAARRRESAALKSGEAFCLASGEDVLLILRYDGDSAVLTAVNRAPETRRYFCSFRGIQREGELQPYSWTSEGFHFSNESFLNES